MPVYVLIGRDGPEGLARRPDAREGHLAHWRPLSEAGRIHFAGPLRDGEGQPVGSVIVFEAESLEAARALAEPDPYVTAGVFAQVDVYESLRVFPED